MRKMNNVERKKIITEVKKLMSDKFIDFNSFSSGEYESAQDEYIEIVCKEKGWELKDFYNTNGKLLNKLLN